MTERLQESVGLVGLGTMGGAIAVRLLEQGINLTVHDVNPDAVERLRSRTTKPVKVAGTLEDLAAQCSIILCSLAHPDILTKVVVGPGGLHARLASGSVVVDLSTSGPEVVRRCGETLKRSGIEMVDATIGRGPAAALRGDLVLMLGGAAKTLDRIDPLVRLLAGKVVRCGPLGAAQVIKLANNLVACANLAVIAEAYQLVKSQGGDPNLLLNVMQGTYADSFQLQHSVSSKALSGDFENIVFRLDLATKDVQLARDAARAGGHEGRISEAVRKWYSDAVSAGYGGLDWAAVMLVADSGLQKKKSAA